MVIRKSLDCIYKEWHNFKQKIYRKNRTRHHAVEAGESDVSENWAFAPQSVATITGLIINSNTELNGHFNQANWARWEAYSARNQQNSTMYAGSLSGFEWSKMDPALFSSNWHKLFPASDERSKLTWQNRFPKAGGKMHNWYSTGEDLLAPYASFNMF